MRGSRKQCIEIGECIGVSAKPRARGAAIKESIAMRRIAREHRVVTGSGFIGAVERIQCISAIDQRLRVARPQRQRLVEVRERFGVAFERVQHIGEIDQRIGRVRIDLQRRRHQAMRLTHLAALRLDQAEQVQRVEIVRRGLERTCVEFFGFAQASLLMQAQRLLQSLRNVEGP